MTKNIQNKAMLAEDGAEIVEIIFGLGAVRS